MKRSFALMLCAAAAVATAVSAQPANDSEIAALRAQIEQLTARLDELEQRTASEPEDTPVTVTPQPAEIAEWPNRVRLSGDLRYRHETINDDASVTERHRHRIRARIGIAADVAEDLTVGVTLSTGEDNPISGNQSLDTGFSRKSIGFDRAFFQWAATDSVTIRGGKMGNPFFRPGGHHLIYDGDLNPEGLALRYDNDSFFANVASFWAEERGSGDDSLLMAGQAGYRGLMGDGLEFTAGISYYDYRNTLGQTPFFDGTARGNLLDAAGGYLNDYNEVELFAEANFDLAGQPVRVFADYVTNTEADIYDTGYAVGIRYRRASEPGSWDLSWVYEDLEANAVIATFTDSDFAGGGTDGKGHVFQTNYVFRERWNLGLKYFLNERGAAAGNERDYKRLQADVSFRY